MTSSPLKRFPLPPHLAGTRATGIHENEVIAQYELGNYKNFVYLCLDWNQRKAAVIDPQSDLQPILKALRSHDFELTHLIVTHSHMDHIAGVPKLMKTFSNLELWIHPKDARRLNPQDADPKRVHLLKDEETISIGSLSLKTMHTPGHSSGECCYLLDHQPPYLFTGDTVFIRDCGRTDLESGSNEEMFESLQKIRRLPENTILLPGHHYQRECATVLGQELIESPPFKCQSVQELASLP